MMRSLWSGVSGLQAHQIAMDVEGNNIANVNTTGFKYSRVSFADLLNQTSKIATAPQGELGGKNPMQVGLGTSINAITKIFKQGSIQTTDKNTDLAIQGDGFFVVSPDGGQTYKYSRNGDFVFDANGNFVDANGYIVQGWLKDEATGLIDTTTPIQNITIPPGLTTPAKETGEVILKANLNSGDKITSRSPIYQLDANHGWVDRNGDGIMTADEIHTENDLGETVFNTDKKIYERGQDFGALFNSVGESFNLQDNQGVWISYTDAKNEQQVTGAGATVAQGTQIDINLILNGKTITGTYIKQTNQDENADLANKIAALINAKTNETGIEATTSGTNIILRNNNKSGTDASMKNIKMTIDSTDDTGLQDASVTTAFLYRYTSTAASPTPTDRTMPRTFKTTEDLRLAMQHDARLNVNYDGDRTDRADKNDGVEVRVTEDGKFQITNPAGDAFNVDDGDLYDATATNPTYLLGNVYQDIQFPTGTSFSTGAFTNHTGANIVIPASVNSTGADITIADGANNPAFTLTAPFSLPGNGTVDNNHGTATGAYITYNDADGDGNGDVVLLTGTNYRAKDDYDMNIAVTAYATDTISENVRFYETMGALQGNLPSGNTVRTSQQITAASHAASIDIFDSLGTKHTVRLEFVKLGFTPDGGTEWQMKISVPEPGDINGGIEPKNIVMGAVKFKADGSLDTYNPTNITFTANNGSSPNQNININLGTAGLFDGMTSFDRPSSTTGISQDGYPGGDLVGIRIDESGTLIGSFSNGRSFGLAQVAMASFANNEGLEADGGNVFIQTSNSGNPIIGTAGTGKRGAITASALEMSNVDLSRSLTQLIVVQRGFQANSKTITTSDQMLQTLLQLKQ